MELIRLEVGKKSGGCPSFSTGIHDAEVRHFNLCRGIYSEHLDQYLEMSKIYVS